MNLLNRYLQEVGKYLPKVRRDDIIAELRANILAQIEDREQELARPLADDELVEILQHHGAPAIVAGRYFKPNLGFAFGIQLIGPELFPFYRTVLCIIWGFSLVVMAVVLPIVTLTVGEKVTVTRVLTPLLFQFVVATAIFIFLDRGKGHWLNQWNPRELPAVKEDADDGPSARNIFSFVVSALGTVCLALPRWPYLFLGSGGSYIETLPVKVMPEWRAFYWEIVALLGVQVLLQLFHLFRLLQRRRARIADLIVKCWGLSIAIHLLLKAPAYVTSPYREVADWANLSFLICVIVALSIGLWGIGRVVVALLRDRHQMLPAGQH